MLALYFYRKVALLFSWFFVNFDIHPNIVTILWFVFTIFWSILILRWYLILWGILWLTSFTLDCADWIVARFQNKQSLFWKYLDITLDRISFSIAVVTILYLHFWFTNILFTTLVFFYIIINWWYDQLSMNYQNQFGTIHSDKIKDSKESIIKKYLNKLIPFIDWKNVVIWVSWDVLWSWLFFLYTFSIFSWLEL